MIKTIHEVFAKSTQEQEAFEQAKYTHIYQSVLNLAMLLHLGYENKLYENVRLLVLAQEEGYGTLFTRSGIVVKENGSQYWTNADLMSSTFYDDFMTPVRKETLRASIIDSTGENYKKRSEEGKLLFYQLNEIARHYSGWSEFVNIGGFERHSGWKVIKNENSFNEKERLIYGDLSEQNLTETLSVISFACSPPEQSYMACSVLEHDIKHWQYERLQDKLVDNNNKKIIRKKV